MGFAWLSSLVCTRWSDSFLALWVITFGRNNYPRPERASLTTDGHIAGEHRGRRTPTLSASGCGGRAELRSPALDSAGFAEENSCDASREATLGRRVTTDSTMLASRTRRARGSWGLARARRPRSVAVGTGRVPSRFRRGVRADDGARSPSERTPRELHKSTRTLLSAAKHAEYGTGRQILTNPRSRRTNKVPGSSSLTAGSAARLPDRPANGEDRAFLAPLRYCR